MESLFNKIADLLGCKFIKRRLLHVLSGEYCKVFKKSFLYRTRSLAASECIGKSLFTYGLRIHKLCLKF